MDGWMEEKGRMEEKEGWKKRDGWKKREDGMVYQQFPTLYSPTLPLFPPSTLPLFANKH